MKNEEKKQGGTLVQLDVLGARKGHESETISVQDDNPECRAELAAHVATLLKSGFAVMLSDGSKVVGYDDKTNSWLVKGKAKKPNRVSAEGTPATAVALPAGG